VPRLLIKNLPADLHKRLKVRAAENRRSLSSEVLAILDEVLRVSAGPPCLADIDRLRIRGRKLLTQELLDEARA
jgi:plasmid stability protein